MAPLRKMKLTDVNKHVTCPLCRGYLIEATTIIECLHVFCKSCIVRYLDSSAFCPVCEVQVHKTKPLNSLREDKTLQDVVYKLVPGLFHSEMDRRVEFYKQHPEAEGDKTELSLREKRHFYHEKDLISLSLEFLPPAHAHAHALGLKALRAPPKGSPETHKHTRTASTDEDDLIPPVRYLQVTAGVSIRVLEKFIRIKYDLTPSHRVDIVHGSDCLSPEITLLDVVYMYKWQEDAPLQLQYTVLAPSVPVRKAKRLLTARPIEGKSVEHPAKKPKLDTPEEVAHDASIDTDTTDDDKMVIDESPLEKDSKESSIESLQVFVNGSSSSIPSSSSKSTAIGTTVSSASLPVSTSSALETPVHSLPSKVTNPLVPTTSAVPSSVPISLGPSWQLTPIPPVSSVRPSCVPPALNMQAPSMNMIRPIANASLSQFGVTNKLNGMLPSQANLDPSKPRLGRPPNSARIAAAAGRPALHPILPRGPTPRSMIAPPGSGFAFAKPKKKLNDVNRNPPIGARNGIGSSGTISKSPQNQTIISGKLGSPKPKSLPTTKMNGVAPSLEKAVPPKVTLVSSVSSSLTPSTMVTRPLAKPVRSPVRTKANSGGIITDIASNLATKQLQQIYQNSAAVNNQAAAAALLNSATANGSSAAALLNSHLAAGLPFSQINPALYNFQSLLQLGNPLSLVSMAAGLQQKSEPAPVDLSSSKSSMNSSQPPKKMALHSKTHNGVTPVSTKSTPTTGIDDVANLLMAKNNGSPMVQLANKQKKTPILPKSEPMKNSSSKSPIFNPKNSLKSLPKSIPSPLQFKGNKGNSSPSGKKNSITMVPTSKSPVKSVPVVSRPAPLGKSNGSVPSPKLAQSPSPTSPAVPSSLGNISAPTPEVTITKLATTPMAINHTPIPSATTVIKSSHVNTVSITKRPTFSSPIINNNNTKLPMRPSNSSVRQIPNPSLLSHQKPDLKNKSVKADT